MSRKQPKPLTMQERMRAKSEKDIIVGIIASNMGEVYLNCLQDAGKAVHKHIATLSYREFRAIKKLYSETTNNKTETTK